MITDEYLRWRLTKSLPITSKLWRRAVDTKLTRHSLSEASAAALIGIGSLGDGVRQNVLAEYIGIESPSLVRQLDQLEKRNLVARRDDPGDRRAKNLWLTEEGKAMSSCVEIELDAVRLEIL
ncbi:MarR family winged helix-turn-helix transcriptional regulator [Rhizobium leguminosarum]|nr:MarR family transcriptional regulator [Rhizobium leguminosarum]MCA2436768.1 MarR family transcriptional regulator [Rhizobium leguminosarum]NEH73420.1 MarR family transcriptional regulator [Rhizobium leguminosarum]